MTYVLYVAVKLLCYVGWCWLGLRLWRPEHATSLGAFRFGVVRLFIGIIFGFFIFFGAGANVGDNLLWDYLKIYTPVRLVEWFILAWLILRHSPSNLSRTWLWCLGGIIVSFAADLASPEGLEGHFCIGRCLC